MRSRGRPPRRFWRSWILRIPILILSVWTFLEAVYIHRILLAADDTPVSRVNTEKIFITSLPWNNEIIFRTHLTNQIRDLVHALGIHNVYISIYENGSYDGTKDALRDLHRELEALGVRNRVTLDETSHADIVRTRPTEPKEGWIKIEKTGFEKMSINEGDYALRRIHYLAQLRNKVLEPLWELAEKGERFDKVLFLNDVVFSSDDIFNLLQTKNGHYAAACSLDFQSPPAFYDTFALRDDQGYLPMMLTWPYFRSAASSNAILRGSPAPVQSCWNGVVAMNAEPFYDKTHPLRFRGVPNTLAHRHVEGSECCLIHADNRLSKDLGVWINPKVRVGYCHADLGKRKVVYDWNVFKEICQVAYDSVHPVGGWVSHFQIAKGLWVNRFRRWFKISWLENLKARQQLSMWRQEDERNVEVGEMCLIDEMHVIEPHGWLHV